eukprot:7383712-Prymnesium_polylepis.1
MDDVQLVVDDHQVLAHEREFDVSLIDELVNEPNGVAVDRGDGVLVVVQVGREPLGRRLALAGRGEGS